MTLIDERDTVTRLIEDSMNSRLLDRCQLRDLVPGDLYQHCLYQHWPPSFSLVVSVVSEYGESRVTFLSSKGHMFSILVNNERDGRCSIMRLKGR